ncbi:MAG: hypothetical protein ACLRSW_08555 [Christensenellaceae bacterium]
MWVTSVTHCRTKITTKNGAKTRLREGIYEIDGHKFAVGNTACGDGEYEGTDGYSYSVDAGVIGYADGIMRKNDTETLTNCRYVKAKRAEFKAEDGMFHIRFDTGETIDIDTQECIDEGYDEFDIKEDW